MHYLVIINFLFFSFLSFLSSEFAFSAVKIKGGVITSAEVLKTVKPNKRDDLIIDLNKIDLVHLDKKISIAEAIRFENRIGESSPLATQLRLSPSCLCRPSHGPAHSW